MKFGARGRLLVSSFFSNTATTSHGRAESPLCSLPLCCFFVFCTKEPSLPLCTSPLCCLFLFVLVSYYFFFFFLLTLFYSCVSYCSLPSLCGVLQRGFVHLLLLSPLAFHWFGTLFHQLFFLRFNF